jgi:chorismate-pyruvate lyase
MDLHMNKAQTDRQQSSDYITRPDLQKSLVKSHIDPARLSVFQRILLTTDGTVTEMLEAYLSEKIKLVKLSETVAPTTQDNSHLDIASGQEVIERKILLRGNISHNNWVCAESTLVPDRLDEKLKHGLLVSQEPMGRLWLENKLETFKEIVDSAREPAEDLADYFKIGRSDKLLSRTYRVFSRGKPIFLITEKFPEAFFREPL